MGYPRVVKFVDVVVVIGTIIYGEFGEAMMIRIRGRLHQKLIGKNISLVINQSLSFWVRLHHHSYKQVTIQIKTV